MTPVQSLLAWLQVVAPAWMDRADLSRRLRHAQAHAPHADLADALAALDRGQSPDVACERWFRDCRGLLRGAPVGPVLEEALLVMASRLPRWEWRGETMANLENAVTAGRRGDAALISRALANFETRLEAAWEPYCALPLSGEDVTAEAVVGHRMLQAGVQAAYDASAMLAARRWEEGLGLAEQAFRALVAVRKMHERLAVLYGPAEHQYLG